MKSHRKLSVVASVVVVLAGLMLAAPAYAELSAFMRVTANKQGSIKGSVTQKGREGTIMVIASEHSLVSPTDSASGQATGKRQHKPFVITKELDKSSVPLRTALVTNESLNEVVIQYYAPSKAGTAAGGGVESLYMTVTLKNAHIVNIRHVMPNNRDAELSKLAAYEEISFVYQSITWNWADGNVTATDDWAPK